MNKQKRILAALALLGAVAAPPSHAGAQPYVGQVMCGGWNFAPQGWMEMQGQLLPIDQFQTLFDLIGTTWGGDGQQTFALPDLRGRAIAGAGAGPGLAPHPLGEVGGTESVTLNASQMPVHNHGFRPPASLSDATATSPAGKVAANKARTTLYAPGLGDVAMQAVQSGVAGGSQPVNNMQPYLAVKCVVAVFGIFPSQN